MYMDDVRRCVGEPRFIEHHEPQNQYDPDEKDDHDFHASNLVHVIGAFQWNFGPRFF